MCPTTSCSTKCWRIALVDVVHDRRGQRQQVAREVLHLLGHLEARGRRRASAARARRGGTAASRRRRSATSPAHRRARAGGRRRAGSRRRAPRRCSAAPARRPASGRRAPLGQPDARPDPLDERRLEPGLLGDVVERARLAVVGEQVLEEAVREPALLARRADLLERVPALAQARDDPCVGDRRGSPRVLAVDAPGSRRSAAQRFNVAGVTPTRSATSFSVRVEATAS